MTEYEKLQERLEKAYYALSPLDDFAFNGVNDVFLANVEASVRDIVFALWSLYRLQGLPRSKVFDCFPAEVLSNLDSAFARVDDDESLPC